MKNSKLLPVTDKKCAVCYGVCSFFKDSDKDGELINCLVIFMYYHDGYVIKQR